MRGDAERHAAQLVVKPLAVRDVAREGLLVPDRDVGHGLVEAARVDAAGAVAEEAADLPGQEARQLLVGERGQLADGLDAGAGKALLCPRPDAR